MANNKIKIVVGAPSGGGGGGGDVLSVFGRTGIVEAQNGDYNKSQVGLGNVDNTSDLDKPISNDTQEALDDRLKASDTFQSDYDGGTRYTSFSNNGKYYITSSDYDLNNPPSNGDNATLIGMEGNKLIFHVESYTGGNTRKVVGINPSTSTGLKLQSEVDGRCAYYTPESYDNLDWDDENDKNRLPPIEVIKANTLRSTIIGEPSGSTPINNIVEISQADYDAAFLAGTTVATTLYLTPQENNV